MRWPDPFVPSGWRLGKARCRAVEPTSRNRCQRAKGHHGKRLHRHLGPDRIARYW